MIRERLLASFQTGAYRWEYLLASQTGAGSTRIGAERVIMNNIISRAGAAKSGELFGRGRIISSPQAGNTI